MQYQYTIAGVPNYNSMATPAIAMAPRPATLCAAAPVYTAAWALVVSEATEAIEATELVTTLAVVAAEVIAAVTELATELVTEAVADALQEASVARGPHIIDVKPSLDV